MTKPELINHIQELNHKVKSLETKLGHLKWKKAKPKKKSKNRKWTTKESDQFIFLKYEQKLTLGEIAEAMNLTNKLVGNLGCVARLREKKKIKEGEMNVPTGFGDDKMLHNGASGGNESIERMGSGSEQAPSEKQEEKPEAVRAPDQHV